MPECLSLAICVPSLFVTCAAPLSLSLSLFLPVSDMSISSPSLTLTLTLSLTHSLTLSLSLSPPPSIPQTEPFMSLHPKGRGYVLC